MPTPMQRSLTPSAFRTILPLKKRLAHQEATRQIRPYTKWLSIIVLGPLLLLPLPLEAKTKNGH